jgi:Rrf2 family protein
MLTRAADYGARVMIHLATLAPGARIRLAALAEAAEVPPAFLSKVLQALVRARLVASSAGVKGGFELVVSADKVSLLDVLEAIDGPLQLNACVATPSGCDRQTWCAAHLVWAEAQLAMTKILRSATLAKLAKRSLAQREAQRTRLLRRAERKASQTTTAK